MEITYSSESKGFFRSLYDFNFLSLIASRFLKFVYAISVVVYTVVYAGLVIVVLTQKVGGGVDDFGTVSQSHSLAPAALVLVPLYFITLIWLRIFMEFLIVFFRMGEDVHAVRLASGSTRVEALELTKQEIAELATVAEPQKTPAGWYDAPSDPTQLRYWDGKSWTEHHSAKSSPQPT